jgi:hypothetical protein
MAYWTPLATAKSVSGRFSIDHVPMSAIALGLPSFSMR